MSIIGDIVGASTGINLINGKIKPSKKGIKTYIVLSFFVLLFVIFLIAFIWGLMNLSYEFILFSSLGILSFGYLILISPYTQNSNNYYIKVKNSNSFKGFELYYKQKKIDMKFTTDQEGKFKWANNDAKLECISYCDNTKMSNFTKYRIINYFSTWLLDNNYLSKDVTVTFEKL